MLKIFVTGDNHLGLKYASYKEKSKLIAARISAFENMVETANRENCGLLVITGDLFDNTKGITQRELKSLLDILYDFNGTVAVLPGNHDYYDRDVKVWQDFNKLTAGRGNIMLLTEYAPNSLKVDGEDVVLYPAFCKKKHSEAGQNNLGWIKAQNLITDATYRIGIAHGAVEGETIDSEGQYFLMRRKELESIPVDVWLIGHTHVPFPRNLKTDEYTEGERIFNAGTHVQTDVACNTEGCCFIIEISEDKAVRAKKVISGNVRFFRREIVVTAGEMQNKLIGALADIPDNSVVEIILNGAVTAEEYDIRADIIENALKRFIDRQYNDSNLSKLISKKMIEEEFPETSFSATLLTELMAEPKEAQLAYELLKSLKEGK